MTLSPRLFVFALYDIRLSRHCVNAHERAVDVGVQRASVLLPRFHRAQWKPRVPPARRRVPDRRGRRRAARVGRRRLGSMASAVPTRGVGGMGGGRRRHPAGVPSRQEDPGHLPRAPRGSTRARPAPGRRHPGPRERRRRAHLKPIRRRQRRILRRRHRRRQERGQPRHAVAIGVPARRRVHVHRRRAVREIQRGHHQDVDHTTDVLALGLERVRGEYSVRRSLGRGGDGRDAAACVHTPRQGGVRARE